MGLNLTRRIVTALLPNDYREHVLGDLEERGFRLRDAISVLPGIWMSRLQRNRFPWLGLFCGVVVGGCLAKAIKMPYSVGSVVILLFAIIGLRGKPNLRVSPISIQMVYVLGTVDTVAYFWPSFTLSRQQIAFVIAMILLFIFHQMRARRVQRETDSLK